MKAVTGLKAFLVLENAWTSFSTSQNKVTLLKAWRD